jgi:eukaryotic-like serine/threonine-protein kinase
MAQRRSISLILPLLVVAVLLFGGWSWLRLYTRHGVAMRVPELQGLTLEEATVMLEKRDLRALVIDSVYTDDLPKGSVVDQDPDPGIDVKPGRKVYLVLNANQPKMIDMPGLVDLSKRQAMSVLEIVGLKVKELQYRPDPCLDCVIEQRYKGLPIAANDKIRRGEAITLVLGGGEKGERVPVPDLRGLTQADVSLVLNMASLNPGIVVDCNGCNSKVDSTLARVYRQSPAVDPNNRIAMGSVIDLWLTTDTAGLRPQSGWNDPSRYITNDTLDVIE